MKLFKSYIILAIAGLGLVICSCKKGCTDPNAVNYDSQVKKDDGSCQYPEEIPFSTFTFEHKVSGSNLVFDSFLYTAPAGQSFSVENLKYFISNISLYKTNGDSVYIDTIYYIDAKNSSGLSFTTNEIIENTSYLGIGFIFGLNDAKNVTNAFVDPPESLMEWPVPMGGGYHYMKLEGKYDSLGTTKNYNLHTGRLMMDSHHFHVAMNFAFTVSNGSIKATLSMDILNWLQNPNLFDFDVFGDAIMGDSTAQVYLEQNGSDVFSIKSVE